MPQFELINTPPTSASKVVSLPPQIPTDLTAVKADVTVIKSKVLPNLDAPMSAVLAKLDNVIGKTNPYNIIFPEVANKRFALPKASSGNYYVTDGFMDFVTKSFHLNQEIRQLECGGGLYIEGDSYIENIGDIHLIFLIEIVHAEGTQLYFAKV